MLSFAQAWLFFVIVIELDKKSLGFTTYYRLHNNQTLIIDYDPHCLTTCNLFLCILQLFHTMCPTPATILYYYNIIIP